MGKTLLVLKLGIIRYLNALGGFSFYRSSELVFPYAFLTWKIFIIFQVVVVGGFQGRIQGGWIGWISTPHFSVKKNSKCHFI